MRGGEEGEGGIKRRRDRRNRDKKTEMMEYKQVERREEDEQ